jgi:hypothetical protein
MDWVALPHTRGVTPCNACFCAAGCGSTSDFTSRFRLHASYFVSPHAWGYGQRCCPGRKNPPLRRGVPGLWTGLLFPTRVGYTMQCMVLRSRLRRYFGLSFILPTSYFRLRISTRVGYTMRCMILRSRLRRYFGLYFTLPTLCFLLRIPTRVGYTMQCMVLRSRLRRDVGLDLAHAEHTETRRLPAHVIAWRCRRSAISPQAIRCRFCLAYMRRL